MAAGLVVAAGAPGDTRRAAARSGLPRPARGGPAVVAGGDVAALVAVGGVEQPDDVDGVAARVDGDVHRNLHRVPGADAGRVRRAALGLAAGRVGVTRGGGQDTARGDGGEDPSLCDLSHNSPDSSDSPNS
ncbi:hypothetical protein GCM10025734_67630 [Kitasatospora paranensis]